MLRLRQGLFDLEKAEDQYIGEKIWSLNNEKNIQLKFLINLISASRLNDTKGLAILAFKHLTCWRIYISWKYLLPYSVLSILTPTTIIFFKGTIHKCYPFDLCYSKCRFSTDRIKQGDLVFNVYYLLNKVLSLQKYKMKGCLLWGFCVMVFNRDLSTNDVNHSPSISNIQQSFLITPFT